MKRWFFSILIIGVFCFNADKIFAQCSCVPESTLKESFQRSYVVFVGKVIEAKKTRLKKTDNYDVVVKFEVKQVWKQDLERFVIVKDLNGSTNGFDQNAEWQFIRVQA